MHRPDDMGAWELPEGLESPLDFAVAERNRSTMDMVRNALDRQDVVLAFQPVVQGARPGNVAFYEGLIRILDDTGRVIPASDFIEAAETSQIGRKVDCLALEMGLIALSENPALRLSINMSARSIGSPHWMRVLKDGLRADPTAGDRLILEITESSAMMLPDLVGAFMHDQQCSGIAFALDDFGAGHTSFRYLREFYFDLVKIDSQFIRGIAQSADNQVLTAALQSISRHFDMFTVATGVETAADAAFLQQIGIDCMQGYYYGAPTIQPPWKTPARKCMPQIP
ncbi:EAL domain-containing protein [Frigidibacter mobilis]|uniref:EAL domain-containing protein n=1 Tax=Frigidibacter mobilis TaxID=1335048 RepID=A0A159Z0L9_9RHOB|nr:EAL domain-containing protein [Frigidibacter mobilis]AMY67424.1 EAL domain-containing protein [Frigidibacter mobilis]